MDQHTTDQYSGKISSEETRKNQAHTQEKQTNQEIIDAYDYLSNAASSQDCTGLIPSAPMSSSELESYEDLYHFLPPSGKVKEIDSDGVS